MFTKAFIPFRGYYSTPFSKWQMTLANEHSLVLASATAARWLAEKKIEPTSLDYLYLGYTVHQRQAFYGAPWVAAMIGAEGIPGCNISQACSTATTSTTRPPASRPGPSGTCSSSLGTACPTGPTSSGRTRTARVVR